MYLVSSRYFRKKDLRLTTLLLLQICYIANLATAARSRLDLIFAIGTVVISELQHASGKLDGKMDSLVGQKYQKEVDR